MRAEELLQNLYPYIGGNENVCHFQAMDDVLYIRLKDQGKADLDALRQFQDILSVELKRGKLQIQAKEFFEPEDNNMSKKDYKALANQILKNVGGKENITLCFHCITRLRFELKDKSKVNEDELKKISGVVTLQWAGDQLQVVVGTDVEKYFSEIEKILPKSSLGSNVDTNLDADLNEESKKEKKQKNIGTVILEYLSGSIIPILPILTACGLVSVIVTVLEKYCTNFVGEGTISILNGIYNAGFYFMPIFLSFSAAKKLKTNEYIAALMGALMVYPSLMGVEGISFLGFTMPTYTYTSTMIPAFITVFVLSYVEKLFKKIIPSVVSYVFVPTCTALVMGFITLFITAPLGAYLGVLLGNVVTFVNTYLGIIAIPVFAAFFPILVMTGMHTAVLLPLLLTEMTTFGYTIWGSACLAYMPAMAGATLAVAYKTKNKDLKQLATSSGITVLLAASEPALYGVLLRLKRPLVSCMIASAIGAFFVGLFQIQRYAMGSFNVFTFVMFVGENNMNIILAVSVFVFTLILSFILTCLIGWKEPEEA